MIPRDRAGDPGVRRALRLGGVAAAVSLLLLLLAAGPTALLAADELAAAAGAVATGDLENALERLSELFSKGYPTPSRTLADQRFAPLREDPEGRARWRALLASHVRESSVTMVVPDEPGERMRVLGRVVRSPEGAPIAGAVLEIYHTDATGHYEPGESIGDDARARLFAFVRSDADGRFELTTVKPAPYPGASEGAAHVHFRVRAHGYRSYGADFRPYDHPRDPAERAASLERGWRFSTVRRDGGVLVCEVTIPMLAETG